MSLSQAVAEHPSRRRKIANSAPAQHQWVSPTDCREGMAALPDNGISLILTDPPYFIDGMDDTWDRHRLRERCKGTGVVGGLPVGMKFDVAQGRRLQAFLEPIARTWLRVLKPGGFVLCFSQPRLVHRAAVAIENAGFEIRDVLAWCYEGQAKAFSQEHFVRRRGNLSQREKANIIKALGGRKTPQLKPQMESIILAQSPREGTFVDNWLKYKAGLIDVASPFVQPEKFPGTLIPVPKVKRRHDHMTEKPLPLLRHLIRIFSNNDRDALVLDPFAGSGSTGAAALLENRSFIGFEIDPHYAAQAERRVESVI